MATKNLYESHKAEEKWLLIVLKSKDTYLKWGGTVFLKNKIPGSIVFAIVVVLIKKPKQTSIVIRGFVL